MNQRRDEPAAFSIIGLIIVLGMAWGLDDIMAALARRNAQTFTLPYLILWSHVLGSLLLAAALLLLFWYTLNRAPRRAWLAALYVLVGLFFALFPVLYFVPAIGGWMPVFFVAPMTALNSYTTMAGSFIAFTGLLMPLLSGAS